MVFEYYLRIDIHPDNLLSTGGANEKKLYSGWAEAIYAFEWFQEVDLSEGICRTFCVASLPS